jgi:hypothetical protein
MAGLTSLGFSPPQMYAWVRNPRMEYARRHSGSDRNHDVVRTGRVSIIDLIWPFLMRDGSWDASVSHE